MRRKGGRTANEYGVDKAQPGNRHETGVDLVLFLFLRFSSFG